MTTKMMYRRRLLAETKLINRLLKSKGIGYWEVYLSNGNLWYKGNYDNRNWYFYNEDGSLKEIINYDN